MQILPDIFAQVLGVIAIVICGVIITIKIVDLSRRKNTSFDEYDIAFDPETANMAPPSASGDGGFVKIKGDFGNPIKSLDDVFSNNDNNCIGGNCCGSGTIYDEDRGICVVPQASNSSQNEKNKKSSLVGYKQSLEDEESSETQDDNKASTSLNNSMKQNMTNAVNDADSDDSLDD